MRPMVKEKSNPDWIQMISFYLIELVSEMSTEQLFLSCPVLISDLYPIEDVKIQKKVFLVLTLAKNMKVRPRCCQCGSCKYGLCGRELFFYSGHFHLFIYFFCSLPSQKRNGGSAHLDWLRLEKKHFFTSLLFSLILRKWKVKQVNIIRYLHKKW